MIYVFISSELFYDFLFLFSNTFATQKVHLSGVGDFQLGQIDILKDPFPINERKNSNAMDSEDSGIQVVIHHKFTFTNWIILFTTTLEWSDASNAI